jgi:hypothetical protein
VEREAGPRPPAGAASESRPHDRTRQYPEAPPWRDSTSRDQHEGGAQTTVTRRVPFDHGYQVYSVFLFRERLGK